MEESREVYASAALTEHQPVQHQVRCLSGFRFVWLHPEFWPSAIILLFFPVCPVCPVFSVVTLSGSVKR